MGRWKKRCRKRNLAISNTRSGIFCKMLGASNGEMCGSTCAHFPLIVPAAPRRLNSRARGCSGHRHQLQHPSKPAPPLDTTLPMSSSCAIKLDSSFLTHESSYCVPCSHLPCSHASASGLQHKGRINELVLVVVAAEVREKHRAIRLVLVDRLRRHALALHNSPKP
jgi:hypothetical protein